MKKSLIFPLSNGFLSYIYIVIKGQTFNRNQKKPKKMLKLSQIKEAITNKGLKVETISADKSKNGNEYVGFSENGTVWFWFTQILFSNGNEYTNFDHRYNQANGSIMKSWKQEQKALALLGL